MRARDAANRVCMAHVCGWRTVRARAQNSLISERQVCARTSITTKKLACCGVEAKHCNAVAIAAVAAAVAAIAAVASPSPQSPPPPSPLPSPTLPSPTLRWPSSLCDRCQAYRRGSRLFLSAIVFFRFGRAHARAHAREHSTVALFCAQIVYVESRALARIFVWRLFFVCLSIVRLD